MVFLDKNTDLDGVKRRLGVGPKEKLRNSRRREAYLRKFARLMSQDPGLDLRFTQQGAWVELDKDHPLIRIPTEEMDQSVTDYSEEVWDLMRQETLTLHELGHVLYTDWPSFKSQRNKVDDHWQDVFQKMWNALEDGAIEKQLRLEFSETVAKAIETTNANLAENACFGQAKTNQQTGEEKVVYTMADGILLGLLTLAVHDSGDLAELRDQNDPSQEFGTPNDAQRFEDFMPRMEEAVEEMLNEPDGEKRNEIVYEFFKDAQEVLEQADVSGRHTQNADGDTSPMDGKPDDSEGDGSGQRRQASNLDKDDAGASRGGASPAPDEGDEEEEGGGGGGDEDGEGEEQEEDGEGGSGDEEGDEDGEGGGADGDDGEASDDEGPGEMETDEALEQQFRQEVTQEAKAMDGGEEKMEEMEQFLDIIKGAGPGHEHDRLEIPEVEEGAANTETEQAADDISRRLKGTLGNRLKQEQRDVERRRQRRGNFSARDYARSGPTGYKWFRNVDHGNKKDYSCVIVQDRSGSMGRIVGECEQAVGGFAGALQDLGVDTCVIDFYGGYCRLAKAFGEDMKDERDVLFSGRADNGTPLSQALYFARERVNRGAGTHPFIIVVTDGQPNDADAYMEELDKCKCPVLGIYLRQELSRDSPSDQGALDAAQQDMDYYHRGVVVCREDSLIQQLDNLASEVMF